MVICQTEIVIMSLATFLHITKRQGTYTTERGNFCGLKFGLKMCLKICPKKQCGFTQIWSPEFCGNVCGKICGSIFGLNFCWNDLAGFGFVPDV